MSRYILILVAGIVMFHACESVYVPELDDVEDVLVVDARLVANRPVNAILLKWSMGFNEKDFFKQVTGANVFMTDDLDNVYLTVEEEPGSYFLYGELDSNRLYQLTVTLDGEIYQSDYEGVPPVPDIDTIYGEHAEQWIKPGGENNTGSFIRTPGKQLFVDISESNEERFYRFYARKIHQFYIPHDTIIAGRKETIPMYAWRSYYPDGTYNLAGPAEHTSSKGIVKHPVEFFLYNDRGLLDTTQRGYGWIYIMHQYGISEKTYQFYKDLNSQLDGEGKIFDPLFVQAQNNLRCISSSGKLVLGNFEIASYREHRFYVKLSINSDYMVLRRIYEFHEIPLRGIQPIVIPWFWET